MQTFQQFVLIFGNYSFPFACGAMIAWLIQTKKIDALKTKLENNSKTKKNDD